MMKGEKLELFNALNKGDFNAAEALVQAKADVNRATWLEHFKVNYDDPDDYYYKYLDLLPAAFAAQRLDIAEFLLKHGADYMSVSEKIMQILKSSDLNFACESMMLIKHFGWRSTILYEQYGAKEGNLLHQLCTPFAEKRQESFYGKHSFPEPTFSRTYAPLIFTVEQLQLLLGDLEINSTLINVKDSEGDTPLHKAIKYNNLPMATWLTKTGLVDLSIEDKAGKTAMQLAEALPDIQVLFAESQPVISVSESRFTTYGKQRQREVAEFMADIHMRDDAFENRGDASWLDNHF